MTPREFEKAHAAELALAAAYQRKGRADATIREQCVEMQAQIYERLMAMLPEVKGEE